MFGNCCNTCCPADSNRGLFGICLNDATLVIILLAIWLLSSGTESHCSRSFSESVRYWELISIVRAT